MKFKISKGLQQVYLPSKDTGAFEVTFLLERSTDDPTYPWSYLGRFKTEEQAQNFAKQYQAVFEEKELNL